MPFNFSNLAKRGKSGASKTNNNKHVFEAAKATPPPRYAPAPFTPPSSPSPSSVYSRPVTATSFDFWPSGPRGPRPSPPPPPPAPPMARTVPDRGDAATPASFSYDNGTGRLHASLVREQGLPPHVRTTEQLADFIKSRQGALSNAPPSSSILRVPQTPSCHYSSSATRTFYHPPSSTGSYERIRFVAGIRHRYGGAPPVSRILPGATRAHKYEGFWLRRGTTRKADAERQQKRGGSKKSSSSSFSNKDNHVETSGWYDD
ncbi:hypothetical protein AYL99_01357 [Fonsecaea erecta]|uniref:Uncharacterized protein n=1 Tax=Fonsecaea erecta TaxID=1367422 RepID=A0A179A2M2_9EURO|nr:hypothetical protein AYL99_01357 [Fonsecaea erecta]OAP65385.1 hypothetical protein AYL99_01357 [Fonsecaea erecta]